ncbi:MAG: ATP-binding protein [Candidatus Helarchaeota archaeon]
MISFFIIPFICSIITFIIGHQILNKNSKSYLNRFYFIFSVIVSFWGFNEGLLYIAPTYTIAYICLKLDSISFIVLPLQLRFILLYTRNKKILKNKLIFSIIYAPVIVFFIINLTTPLISEGLQMEIWGWSSIIPDNPIIYYITLIWALSIEVCIIYISTKYYINNIETVRIKQMFLIQYGFTTPIIASLCLQIIFNLMNISIPNLLIIGVLIGDISIAFAIIKYKLFYKPKYKLIFDKLIEGIAFFEIQFDKFNRPIDLIFLDVNKSFESFTGLNKRDILFSKFSDVILKNKFVKFSWLNDIFNYALQFENVRIERFSDFDERWFFISLYIFSKKFAIILIEDITQKKVLLNELYKQYSELQEINQSKDEIYSEIVHEFRTPLTVIKGFTELNLKNNKLEKFLINDLKIIQKNILRLEESVNEILEYSKALEIEMKLDKKTCDIRDIVKEIIDRISPLIKEKDLKIIKNFDDNTLLKVDKYQIEKVIKNFLTNAIKFSNPNGNIHIKSVVKDNIWRFSVKDEGIGISPDDIKKLFTRFIMLDNSKSINKKGIGIGLALSKRIIEMHQGKIWVESEGINKGSEFIFEIPLE